LSPTYYAIIRSMRNLRSPSDSNQASQSAADLLDQLTTPSRLGQRPGLEKISALLRDLGDPHDGLRILHVGGTSGKGSTATIAARIVQEAGYKVGLHVKPHLEAVEERFVVDGRAIETERVVDLIERASSSARQIGPSWYELTVALAFAYFRDEHVDAAVVEVGLGGTYDATNVVDSSAVVLTNIGLDHTEVLGDTVELIAADKVGIVKPGVPVVSGILQPSARAIVETRCRSLEAALWSIDCDVSYCLTHLGIDGSRFDLSLPTRRLAGLQLRPLGAHQVANAAVAVAGVEALMHGGLSVDETSIRRALAEVTVAGRFEIMREQPLLLLDGAHNPDKMAALTNTLTALYPGRGVIAVLAFKKGHDIVETLRTLDPLLNCAVLTRFEATTDFGRGQAVEPASIDAALKSLTSSARRIVEPDPIIAIQRAIAEATPRDVIVVTGSLYLVGVIRTWLRQNR
jgi:dihydrofolate synthase/folylpolyglutamate synthase